MKIDLSGISSNPITMRVFLSNITNSQEGDITNTLMDSNI